jgi:1-acyl-sn-glycerol-3-phosphate acyltransferase
MLRNNPRGTVSGGIVWGLLRPYAALWHRVRVEEGQNIPRARSPGPLIVVINHTAGVDPLLVQAVVPFEVRWVMSSDMRHPALEWLWRFANVIYVNPHGGEVSGAREAIKHVREGGVLGIFPEGGIERPHRRILPFAPGVGFLIRRTGAPVLPVIVDGTPEVDKAWQSIPRRSRARVTFKPLIDYGASALSAAQIADDLRNRYLEWTGWPPGERKPAATGRPGNPERKAAVG